MTAREKGVRLVSRCIGVAAVLGLAFVGLLYVNAVDVGGVYHPEGWAEMGGKPLVSLALTVLTMTLIWTLVAARLMRLRFSAALGQTARHVGQGMLVALLGLVILLAIRALQVFIFSIG